MKKLSDMFQRFFSRPSSNDSVDLKVQDSLVDYAYKQATVGIVASIFCATILLIGLFRVTSEVLLFSWYIFFLIVTAIRYVLVDIYSTKILASGDAYKWGVLFIASSTLGGISWGLVGAVLLPVAGGLPLVLVILILAGITAGSVPLYSAILLAAILFLVPSLITLVIHLLFYQTLEYILLSSTIFVFMLYLVILAAKSHRLLVKVIRLQFENERLVDNLSAAKRQLEATNKKLEREATHDELTKTLKRNMFVWSVQEAIKRAKRWHKSIGILYLDIDGFKHVNDTYGHQTGDMLLIEITKRIRQNLRAEDVVARLGGDEFAIVMEHIKEGNDLSHRAETLCRVLKEPYHFDTITTNISASIGISIFPTDGEDVEMLLSKADSAMYYIKKISGNGYQYSHDLPSEQAKLPL